MKQNYSDSSLQKEIKEIKESLENVKMQFDVREELAKSMLNIPIYAFEVKVTLKEFSFSKIDPFYIKYGGLTDPIGQVASAIMNFVDRVVSGVKIALESIITGVKNALSRAISGVKGIVDRIWSKIQDVASKVGEIISKIGAGFQSVISRISGAISRGISNVIRGISNVASTLSRAISSGIRGLANTFRSLSRSIMNTISNLSRTFQNAIRGVVQTISGLITGIKTAISNIARSIQNTIRGLAQSIRGIMTQIQQFGRSIIQGVQNAISGLVEKISGIIGQIQSTIGGMVQSIQTAISGVIKGIQEFTGNISKTIGGFIEKVRGFFDNISKTLSSSISGFVNQIKSFFVNMPKYFDPILKPIRNVIEKIKGLPERIHKFFTEDIPRLFSEKIIPWVDRNVIKPIRERIIDPIVNNVSKLIEKVKDIPEKMKEISSAFQGFVNPLVSIGNFFTSIKKGFENFLSAIPQAFSDLVKFIKGLPEKLKDLPEKIKKFIFLPLEDKLKIISEKIKELAKLIWDHLPEPIKNAITSINTTLENLAKWIWDHLPEPIKNAFDTISNILSDLKDKIKDFITNLPKSIDDLVKNIVKTLSEIGKWIWDHLPKALKDAYEKIADFFASAKDHIINFFKDLPKNISEFVNKVRDFITNLPKTFNERIVKPVKEFIDEKIVKPLSDFFKPIKDVLKDPVKAIANFTKSVIETLKEVLSGIWNFVCGVGNFVLNAINNFIGSIIEIIKGGIAWLTKQVTGFFEGIFKGIKSLLGGDIPDKSLYEESYKKYLEGTGISIDIFTRYIVESISYFIKIGGEGVRSYVSDMILKVRERKTKGEFIEAFNLIGLVGTLMFGAQAIPRFVSMGLHAIASFLDKYRLNVKINLPIGGEFAPRFDLAKTIRHIASEIKEHGDKICRDIVYGFAIWITEPVRYLSNLLFRNFLVLEIPTLETLRDLTRRHMGLIGGVEQWDKVRELFRRYTLVKEILKEYGYPESLASYFFNEVPDETANRFGEGGNFIKIRDKMRWFLAMRGFNDEVILWLTAFDNEMPSVKITDRFGNTRSLPTSLLFELPTPSEICRMMIRDVFTVPNDEKTTLTNFIKFLAMKGYNPDTAKLYYLLHYKYPSMDKLYEFSCRLVARQTWIATAPKKELGDIGAEGKSPVGLQETYGLNVELLKRADPKITVDVTSKLNAIIENVLKHYAKWHDYAPFSWIQGWTADNLIYLDLMADIPQRIDARWMYKWTVPIPEEIKKLTGQDYFDERALFLIVVSRGMHPKWIEPVTIAECMNALAEERTLARTGAINLFKEGFMTYDAFKNTLSHLCDITIFGKKIPVRFLPSETELLGVRAKFDRALDILRDFTKDILRSTYEFIISYDDAINKLKNLVSEVAKKLGLKNVGLDKEYFELYRPVAETEIEIRQIERIRYWYRYMLYRILYRFNEGYISEKEFNETINSIVENAKLTEKERKVFEEIAKLMYDGFKKKTLADAVLNKLKRGVITPDEAKEELMNLGLPEDIAEALIEKYSKIYTLSISTLLSYAEYVDIPEDFVRRKLELMGMPEDEIDIVLQVFKIRPLRDGAFNSFVVFGEHVEKALELLG